MSKLKFCFQSVLMLFLCLTLLACSRITQENYDKIKPNMTMREVSAILGEPTSSDSMSIAGVSGTTAVWKDDKNEIDIQFLNDRMTVKTFGKVSNQK